MRLWLVYHFLETQKEVTKQNQQKKRELTISMDYHHNDEDNTEKSKRIKTYY